MNNSGRVEPAPARSYWVVSANIHQMELAAWRKVIKGEKCAFMGWNLDHYLGAKFAGKGPDPVRPGDVVLIASRSNANKELLACGVVDGEPLLPRDLDLVRKYGRLCDDVDVLEFGSARKLKPFKVLKLDPEEEGLRFNGRGVSYGKSSQVAAIYKLQPGKNVGDREICARLDSILSSCNGLRRPTALKVGKSAGSSAGRGFQVDKAKREAVEKYAMKRAVKYYMNLGYRVEDKSSTEPYDLLCRLGERSLYVEVKGTTTEGDVVTVTSGEVKNARRRSPNTELFVVSLVRVSKKDSDGHYKCRGGREQIVRPLCPKAADLTPTEYSYRVPPERGRGARAGA